MKSARQLSQTYLRFANLANAIRDLPSLDAVEERVLRALAGAWATGQRLPVLQAVELTPDASPATVHRRLKSLRAKGMVEIREDQQDARVKYVVPTAETERYFAELGKCLAAAAQGGTNTNR
jgi:DNA-binding transcriptional regulator YhcF (GntR family)